MFSNTSTVEKSIDTQERQLGEHNLRLLEEKAGWNRN